MKANNVSKHLEVETYTLHGVSVMVEINYDAGTISLLEALGAPKKWVFAKRQLEYMEGWQNVLDAMKLAISQATDKLSKHHEARDKRIRRKEIELLAAIKEHNE